MQIEPTESVSYSMGFKKDFNKGLCSYWYTIDTYVEMKRINILRINHKSKYFNLGIGENLPLIVDSKTKEVTIDKAILNLLL